VAVAAINGISGVVRPDGTVAASVPARREGVLVEEVGLSPTTTPAVRLGVWPARLALAFLVCHAAYVLVAYRLRRRSASPSSPSAAQPQERGSTA
jgi:apolipoprotein N-acyltransferase